MNRCSMTDDTTADAITDAIMSQISPETDGLFDVLHNVVEPLHKIAPKLVKKATDDITHAVNNGSKFIKGVNIYANKNNKRK